MTLGNIKPTNIFELRQKDWQRILPSIKQILKPVEEVGYTIDHVDLEPFVGGKNDLMPTVQDKMNIKLKKGNVDIDLSFFLPTLVDGKYFIINGRKKVGQFQIFDKPHVRRNMGLVNNCSIVRIIDKKDNDVGVIWLNKVVPLALLYFSKFSKEECENKLDYWDSLDNSDFSPSFDKFIATFGRYLKQNLTQQDYQHELGHIYTNYNSKKKAEAALLAIDLLPKIDIWIKPFLKHNCILDDIVEVMCTSTNDLDLSTKRIRFVEYLLSSFTKAIFDFCVLSNTNRKKPRINFSQTQILNELNTPIVQFDFSVNPIQELTLLSRVSPVGPGGFEKGSVPTDYRDINDTMYGKICPVDTPDRESCGVIQSLLPKIKLDKNLAFVDSKDDTDVNPVSVTVSLVPFIEHDDQTRLQMSSSQMRQSVLLENLENPAIQTGTEKLYAPYTWFLTRAEDDGEVLYTCNDFMIVKYQNKDDLVVVPLGYQQFTENFNYVKAEAKGKFKKGDTLCCSPSCSNKGITIGKDLLTGIMPWYGYNFEDAVVISSRLVEQDVLTSVHYCDLSFELSANEVLLSLKEDKYMPLPLVGSVVNLDEPYAIIKKVPDNMKVGEIFEEPKIKKLSHSCVITKCQLYVSNYNKDIPEFRDWVEATTYIQEKQNNDLNKQLEKIGVERIDLLKKRFKYCNGTSKRYKIKREPVQGMFVKLEAVYSKKIECGDKLANRHGNKGTVSKIVDHSLMPQLKDGRHLDILLNPLGVISRMNVGQLFELHLGMALHKLRDQSLKIFDKEGEDETKKYIAGFYKILSQESCPQEIKDSLKTHIDRKTIKNLYVEEQPFKSSTKSQVLQAVDYVEAKTRYNLFDPISNQDILNPVAVGYMNIFKLVHMAETKLAARSVGPYAKKTLQPLGGRKRHGAQRCGEMETAALIGHNAIQNLTEFWTVKSDAVELKSDYLKKLISSNYTSEETSKKPETIKLLESYLRLIGVEKRHE